MVGECVRGLVAFNAHVAWRPCDLDVVLLHCRMALEEGPLGGGWCVASKAPDGGGAVDAEPDAGWGELCEGVRA